MFSKKKGRVTLSPTDSNLGEEEKRHRKALQRRVSWRASTDSIQTIISCSDIQEGDTSVRKLAGLENAFQISQWPSTDPLICKRRSSLRLYKKRGSGGSTSTGGSSRVIKFWENCFASKKQPIDGVIEGPLVHIKTNHIAPIDYISEYQGNVNPHSIAVLALDGESKFTFQEINWISDELALYLKPIIEEELNTSFFVDTLKDPNFEPCIGVARNPCEKCLVAILAIWKLKLPYLPFRTAEAPPWRISTIIDSLKPIVILGMNTDKTIQEAAKNGPPVISLDQKWHSIVQNYAGKTPLSKEEREKKFRIEKLEEFRKINEEKTGFVATYIRTATVWNRVYAEWKNFPFDKHEKVGVYASVDSHEFLGQLLAPLLHGNTTVIMDCHELYKFLENIERWKLKRLIVFPELLRALMTVMHTITLLKNKEQYQHHFAHVPNNFFETVKYWFCTGAAFRRELCLQFFKNAPQKAQLINLFGCRELLTFVCFEVFKSIKDLQSGNHFDIIPMGRPVMNTRIYILDSNNEEIVGSSGLGEICVTGPGVSENSHLTSSLSSAKRGPKIITNPFLEDEKNSTKAKLYETLLKTNDYGRLVYRNTTGSCSCLRKDKVTLLFSGYAEGEIIVENYRLNINEIVSHLMSCPGVKGCHVMVYRPGTPSKAILAFVVLSQKLNVTKEEIHIYLRSKIPEYLIPTLIVIPGLPLKNFKINRGLLVETYQKEKLGDEYYYQENMSAELDLEEESNELRATKVLFKVLYFTCGISRAWAFQHKGWTLAELRIPFTSIPDIYKALLQHGYTIEMAEFFASKRVHDILEAMIRNSPPPAPQIALELIQSWNRYSNEIITHSHKREIIKFFMKSNCSFEYIDSLVNYTGMKPADVEETISGIWPLVVYKKYSVAVRNRKTKKIVAALLNADCRDKAYCSQWQNIVKQHPLKYRLEVIDQVDEYLTLQGLINPKYPLNDLGTIFFVNDLKMFSNFEKSIQVLELLFTQAIQVAKSAGFHSMHVTMYNYIFADFIVESFNFEVIETKQVNLFEARDGTKPYHLAPDYISGTVLYKTL